MELEKHITDEKTGISYTLCGDYYLPDLKLPEEKSYVYIYGSFSAFGEKGDRRKYCS